MLKNKWLMTPFFGGIIKASIVTGDPEFKTVKNLVAIDWLLTPAKVNICPKKYQSRNFTRE